MKAKAKTKHRTTAPHALEYQVQIYFDPRDDIYVAQVPELENCHTHGATPEDAIRNAREAIELWLETARRHRIPIPEPLARKRLKKKFSGRFVLRAPSEVHAHLAQAALRRGKSMNDLAVDLIKEGLGDD